MIMSFSVPDNPKYAPLINWYKSQDSQERSRNFREIFQSYIAKPHHINETKAESHISPELPQLTRIDIVRESTSQEIDLDSKLEMLGRRG